MGLFRRGTKLLRLGSGLRDCCCRPEKIEFCDLDFCPYYLEWPGNSRSSADVFLDNENEGFCSIGSVDNVYQPNGLVSARKSYQGIDFLDFFAFLSDQVLANSSVRSGLGVEEERPNPWPQNCYFAQLRPETLGPNYCELFYYTEFALRLEYDYATELVSWSARLRDEVSVRYERDRTESACPSFIFREDRLHYNHWESSGTLQSGCVSNSRLNCRQKSPVRVLEDGIVFTFSRNSFKINGQSFPVTALPGRPVVSVTGWEIDGETPNWEQTLTLRRADTCGNVDDESECDCTQSLDGMIVTFEGQEFTYGQLDSFFNAGTWWEETSAGVFRRRDTESCDGSLNQTVKQATIECTQINGVDTWVCYLDHTCEERDDMTCPGPPDASRNKQWTGVFECDENGKPTGSPGSLEVDSDTTTGTPAAECVDALTVPSISISAPP